MPLMPPAEELLAREPFSPMDLFGRMRSYTAERRFRGTLPAVWQCSDESQEIKKALLGYLFDCPAFNLGRVGALLDPQRLIPAFHHGRDLVILGGSHVGAEEEGGIHYVERIHGEKAPCCGMLHTLLGEYLGLYRRACSRLQLCAGDGQFLVEIPYGYLFRGGAEERARLALRLENLVEGEPVADTGQGKRYALHPRLVRRHQAELAQLGAVPRPVGALLDRDSFRFVKQLKRESVVPRDSIEEVVFDFLPDVVISSRPHRRLADINTWRQFHRLHDALLDMDLGDRQLLVVAGLTIDHSVKRNSFVPQHGLRIEHGRVLAAEFLNGGDLETLLRASKVHRPVQSFLQYAGIS